MAFTVTLLKSYAASSVASAHTVESVSPAAGSLLLVVAGKRSGGTVSIQSITSAISIEGSWQRADVSEGGNRNQSVDIWWAIAGATPGSGTIAASWGANVGATIHVLQIEGAHATPIVQAAGAVGSSSSQPSTTFSPAPVSTSLVIAAATTTNETDGMTPPSGFMALADVANTVTNPVRTAVAYKAGGAAAGVSWSDVAGESWAALAIEIAAGGPDETAPTLQSAAISADGESLTLTFDEAVSVGTGGSGGFTLSASGGAVTATYASGDGTTTLVYSLSRTIEYGEIITLDYTQPGDGIEDAAGNDLASFANRAVANSVALLLESYWSAEDFDVDDVPPEWNAEIDVTGYDIQEASGEKYLELRGVDGEQSILTYLALSPAVDTEIWLRFFFDTEGESGGPDGAILVRGQQLTGRSTMDLYSLNLDSKYSLNRLNDGSNTQIDDATPSPLPGVDSIGQVRLRVEGTSIKARFWADGNSEPETWDFETTDSSITGRGRVGVYSYRGTKVRVYAIGVATGGGTAPKSAVPAEVTTAWIGAATDDAVTAVVEASSRSVMRLAVSENSDMSSPVYGSASSKTARAKLSVSGLDPATTYYWGVELDSVLSETPLGSLKTFPTAGQPASFSVALASCAGDTDEGLQGYPGRTPNISNAPTFARIKDRKPLFFFHMGDFDYRDIEANDVTLYRQAYRDVLAELNQQALYRSVPTVYMWDDHDFGANNSGASNPGRPAALQAYRDMVPHYALPSGAPDDTPVYQSFVAARVRFIILDARSERTAGTILGATQLAWLLNLIETATEPLLVIGVSMPWIAASTVDTWSDAATERASIAEAIETYQKGKVLLVHGDSHMIAIDDGTNSQYAASSDPGPTVFCAAPLDAGNTVKGGPYSEGTFAEHMQQYGAVEITDAGGAISVKLRGFKVEDEVETELVSYTFMVGDGENPALEPVGSTQPQAVQAAALTQHHALAPVSTRQAQAAAPSALTQAHVVEVAGSSQAQASSPPSIAQDHALSAGSTIQAQAAGDASISQAGQLVPKGTEQAQGVAAPATVQAHTLAVSSTAQAQEAGAPAISLHYSFTPRATEQSQVAGAASVSEGLTLSPAGTAQAQAAGDPGITQAHTLAPSGTAQAHSLRAPALVQTHTLAPGSTLQVQPVGKASVFEGGIPRIAFLEVSLSDAIALTVTLKDPFTITTSIGD